MPTKSKPALIVIFGITGDLAKRKLLPALYHLTRDNLLDERTKVIGVTRQDITSKAALLPLETYAKTHQRTSPAALRQFKRNFSLFQMDLAKEHEYGRLKKALDMIEKQGGVGYRRLFYLSIPPGVFDEVVTYMGKQGLQNPYKQNELPGLLIEKPFGYDLASARELIRVTRRYFDEAQIFRIDHYLAKEMAQNILDFRFHNQVFESVWDSEHIDKIVVTAHESIGIEGRTRFYEQTGALRDLIQSHLLQLLSLVAMERPRVMDSTHIHAQRLKLLRAVQPPQAYEVKKAAFRGQYDTYRSEVGHKHSTIETYAAVRLFIQNHRWKGVPFVLRTGKATREKKTEITVYFSGKTANILTLQLQPEEYISLDLNVKQPGHGHKRVRTAMEFSYKRSFSAEKPPEAYERVLLDAIHGDRTLFASSEEVLAAWKIVQPVLSEWTKSSSGLRIYPNGAMPSAGVASNYLLT